MPEQYLPRPYHAEVHFVCAARLPGGGLSRCMFPMCTRRCGFHISLFGKKIDATCPDTLAKSYGVHATSSTGAVAALADGRKFEKHSCLLSSHSVDPVANESLDAFGPLSLAFLS